MIAILETTLWTQQLDKQQTADQSLKHKFSWRNFQTESMKRITNTEQILSQNWMCGTHYQHWTIPVFTKPDALNVEFTLINSSSTKNKFTFIKCGFSSTKNTPPTPQKILNKKRHWGEQHLFDRGTLWYKERKNSKISQINIWSAHILDTTLHTTHVHVCMHTHKHPLDTTLHSTPHTYMCACTRTNILWTLHYTPLHTTHVHVCMHMHKHPLDTTLHSTPRKQGDPPKTVQTVGQAKCWKCETKQHQTCIVSFLC